MGVKITQPFSFDSQKPNFERDTINSNTLFSSHNPLDLSESERLALAANYDVGHIVWDTHTNKYYSVQVDATSGCKLENIIQTVRTMNGEQLTDSTLGDINIHDGFVFPNAVKDTEGYWYDAVVIGNQVWMTENLRTKYIHLDGSDQPTEIEEQAGGSSSTFPADAMRCYKVSGSNAGFNKYGYLYNWMAATGITSGPVPEGFVRGVSPSGWHIPSLTEFDELVNYCIKQDRYPNKKCLATNKKNYWDTNATPNSTFVGINLDQNNATGFNAYPNGAYFGSNDETNQNRRASYRFTCWLATESVNHPGCSRTVGMGYTNGALWPTYNDTGPDNDGNAVDKKKFIGVRCISDMNPTQFRAWYVNEYGSMQHHLPQEIQTLHIGPHDYDGSTEVFVDIYDSDYYISSDYTGGGATTLSGLLDTDITSPQNGEILVYNNGMWENTSKDTLVCHTTSHSRNQTTGEIEYTLDHTLSEIRDAVNDGKDVILIDGDGSLGYIYRLSFWRRGYNIYSFEHYDAALGSDACLRVIGYNQDANAESSLSAKWIFRQYIYRETELFYRDNNNPQISINVKSTVDMNLTYVSTIVCVDTLGSPSTITFTGGASGSFVHLRNSTDRNLPSNGTKVLKISRVGPDYYVESWEPTVTLSPFGQNNGQAQ